nr:AMP-binding protein [Stigmatella aurantiaca]
MQLVLIVVGVLLALVLGWMAYCFVKLGFPERLGLLFGGLASIDKIVDQSAARYGDTTLIELETPLKWKVPAGKVRAAQEQEWSAVRVQQTVALIAGALKKFAKPQMGDRVIIYKENAFDLFLFASATIRIGGIATPVNGKLASESFGQYVTYLGAKVIITDLATLGRLVKDGVKLQGVEFVIVSDAGTDGQDGIPTELAQLPAGPRVLSLQWMLAQPVEPAQAVERGLDDPLYIVHTSGTTGFPKGVILLARGLTQSLKATLMFNLVGRKDLAYFCVPFNHQVTNLYIFTTLALGTRVIMSSEFKAERVLETLSRRRASIYFGFPITYAQLVVEDLTKYDLNAMRIWGTTADASHEVHQRPLIQKGSFCSNWASRCRAPCSWTGWARARWASPRCCASPGRGRSSSGGAWVVRSPSSGPRSGWWTRTGSRCRMASRGASPSRGLACSAVTGMPTTSCCPPLRTAGGSPGTSSSASPMESSSIWTARWMSSATSRGSATPS